ncbi:hypothetical protein K0M31_012682, partial [Melipona bicolor]
IVLYAHDRRGIPTGVGEEGDARRRKVDDEKLRGDTLVHRPDKDRGNPLQPGPRGSPAETSGDVEIAINQRCKVEVLMARRRKGKVGLRDEKGTLCCDFG